MIPVTVYTSTKNRYDSTLPLLLTSILNQSSLPAELIIYDDGDRIDMRNHPVLKNILQAFSVKGIQWIVNFGEGKGQLLNHRKALTDAKYNLIMRVDDDDVMDPNVLDTLYREITSRNASAVGCPIVEPTKAFPKPSFASSKLEDLYLGVNEQWYLQEGEPYEVDHLFSSFMYNRAYADKSYYAYDYSPLAFREETIFTYSLKEKGPVFIVPSVMMWHMHPYSGGGEENKKKQENVINDTKIFETFIKEKNLIIKATKFVCLDNGIGDHYAFLSILDDFKKQYKGDKILIACCYPEIFEDHKDVMLTSIAEFRTIFGDGLTEHLNIYRFMETMVAQGMSLGNISCHYKALYGVK